MIKVGLIDNLIQMDVFRSQRLHLAGADEWHESTGGNTGNLAFVRGTQLMLDNPITRIYWHSDPQYVRNTVDHIVISCANQLGLHVDLKSWAEHLKAINLPVTLLGLGAQTENFEDTLLLPQGTQDFLAVVAELNASSSHTNIGVRGKFSQQILQNYSIDSDVIACPSLYLSPEKLLGQQIFEFSSKQKTEKIAIAAGNPWHKKNQKIEAKLMRIAEQYQGAYIVQHPKSVFQLVLNESEKIDPYNLQELLKIYGFKNSQELFQWFRHYAYLFADVASWSLFLKHFDMVLGARFHGVCLGVQAGIPGLVIAIDNRTRELSESCAIPYIHIDDASLAKELTLPAWDEDQAKKFDTNRSQKSNVAINLFESNQLCASSHLKRIANY